MSYDYEALSDDRFQELCQALLAVEYAGMQCLPVNQPDGGRDATRRAAKGTIVYQIKFSRKRLPIDQARDWLSDHVKSEQPKVIRLTKRGATKYVLMTNVEGSAHLDVGSIDLITSKMKELYGLDSQCLFRADLDRRLDGNWSIKCAYPEILSGTDNLRALIETFAPSRVDTLKALLNAFMTFQYRQDYRVKFKQIGLENRLLDLFTDTPFRVTHSQAGFDAHQVPREWANLLNTEIEEGKVSFTSGSRTSEDALGVSTFLLSAFARRQFPRLVVEGAPGQGKSTLAQYLCQIQRMRWLNAVDDLALVPEDHLKSMLRLPVKVDLRDLAVWLNGLEPFVAERQKVTGVDLTLETFIARLFQHSSGGHQCGVSDLAAIAERSPLLLVLDGLDEVADPKARELVIKHVTEGIARLEGFCPDLQTIVTSRPTIFANSPGFDPTEFPHLTLTSLMPVQVRNYAHRWMNARQIAEGDRGQFMEILDQRLEQPHLRDLARNPMQLAILLELIRTKGAALPDKRTSLYDQYVGLFFDREAEKSAVVRDAREELLQVHGYLAWKLHSLAEEGLTEGRMEVSAIKSEVRNYLQREGHNAEAVEELFTALVERVVMLVSRIQGTFEFEVQPLREYFAGRFLYDSAPPSRTGFERSDTKIDRFDAIARNPYWLNVTRFFAGMFGKGELIDLADRISTLYTDSELRNLKLPARLSAQLLSDWVFFQTPRAVEEVATCLASESGLIGLFANHGFDWSTIPNLSEKCGREIICKGGLALLSQLLKADRARADWIRPLTMLVSRNATKNDVQGWWYAEGRKICGEDEPLWHRLGCNLGVSDRIPKGSIISLFEHSKDFASIVEEYYFHSRGDVVFFDARTEKAIEETVFDSGQFWHDVGPSWFQVLGEVLRLFGYIDDVGDLSSHVVTVTGTLENEKTGLGVDAGKVGPEQRARELIATMKEEATNSDDSLESNLKLLAKFCEVSMRLWGERTATVAIVGRWVSNLSLDNLNQALQAVPDFALLIEDSPLLAKFTEAKRHADDVDYWRQVVSEYEQGRSMNLILFAFCRFASSSIIKKFGLRVFPANEKDPRWEWLNRDHGIYNEEECDPDFSSKAAEWPVAACTVLARRFKSLFTDPVFVARMIAVEAQSWMVAMHLNSWATAWIIEGLIEWDQYLALIKRLYIDGKFGVGIYPPQTDRLQKKMPINVALKIAAEPLLWPVPLWGIAEAVLAEAYKTSVVPVARIAREQKWVSA